MQALLQTPLMLLSALLFAAYVLARRRTARRTAALRPLPRARSLARVRRDNRSQRDRVIDLHQRGAIFTVTEDGRIAGYSCTEFGEVRIDDGPSPDERLKRAAAQRYPAANALIRLRKVAELQEFQTGRGRHGQPRTARRRVVEWRAIAVLATPMTASLSPPAAYRRDLVLIDGSNVMNWEVDAGRADAPSLRPLAEVLAMLKSQGVVAGVVFDANAGHLLEGRFLGHDDMAKRLPHAADVLVVDKGTQADPVLIDMARAEGLVIVSNDHFRDAPAARHLLKQKGYFEDGAVRLLEPRT